MFRFLIFLLGFIFCFHKSTWAFDYQFDGRLRADSRFVIDSPKGFDDFDHALEIRLGGNGDFIREKSWTVDYEVLLDTRYVDGPTEQAGFVDTWDVDFFRAWMRVDKGKWRLRAGRQQILFGAGALFRPLGFFDTRIISSVFPLTGGVDGFRYSYFWDGTTTLQSWIIPAKTNERVLFGGRWEELLGEIETGFALQYSPRTDLDTLPNFDLELIQVGYHLKGEYEVGLWTEARLDLESGFSGVAARFDSVYGVDYTFNLGQGLHVLVEYFLSARENDFTNRDLQARQTIHQFGLQMDQPVGIAAVWRAFMFYDALDGSFQIAPQIEFALTDRIYVYLQGNWGGDIKGDEALGRFFRKGSSFTGTESSLGISLIMFL